MTRSPNRYDVAADSLLTVIALVLLGMLLVHHWQLIKAPVPVDWYEGVMPVITGLIADGENPYTLAHQPMRANVYPPLYNLLVAPLTALFGNSLVLHRSVSGLFILASLGVCAHCMTRRDRHVADLLAMLALVYAGLLFYITPVASTNATGVFFYLLSALLPWYRGFDNTGLALSIGCGLLAFFSKQYFAIGMVIVCLHLLLSVSPRRAMLYGLWVLGSVFGALYLVHLSSPYYLDNVLFSPLAAGQVVYLEGYLWRQLGAYGWLHLGLLAPLGFLAAVGARRVRLPRLNLRDWRSGLLKTAPDYLWLCLLVATGLIVLVLGHNPGNWLSYLFQLISPLLAVAGISNLRRAGIARWIVAPMLAWCLISLWRELPEELSPDTDNWNKLAQLVQRHEVVLASPALLSLLTDYDREVFQDGHTFYFKFAARKPALFQKTDAALRVATLWDNYNRELYRRVVNREFQLVLAGPWDINGFFGANPPLDRAENGIGLFKRHYRKIDTLRINLSDKRGGGTHNIGVWVPREPAE